jgi:glycosyltransferase involved in cell wall biosynthesis
MTIVHVTPYYAPAWEWGGVVEAVTGLARAQAAAGHHVLVITTDSLGRRLRGRAGAERVDGVEVRRARTRLPALRARANLSWPVGFGRLLDDTLRRERPDVVHCHEGRTVETLLALGAAARHATAAVISTHGTLPLDTGRVLAKRAWDGVFARATWRRVQRIVALNEAEALGVRAFAARWRLPHLDDACSIVPNGLDLDRYARLPERDEARRRFDVPSDAPVALFLGRLDARKGVHLLVGAQARAAARGRPPHLLIAGPDAGMGETVARQVDAVGAASMVTMPGLVSGEGKLAAFAAADLFVLPARGEGMSMALLEALAAGVPVVAAREAALLPLEAAGAVLLADRTAGALGEAIARVLADASLQEQLRARGSRWVAAHHAWPHVTASMDDVYRLAIASAGRRGGAR